MSTRTPARAAPPVMRGVPLVLLLLGCPYEDPNAEHCVLNDGDAHCRSLFQTERPFCVRSFCEAHSDARFGCVATVPEHAECRSPCGGESLPGIDGELCLGTTTTGESTSLATTGSDTTLTVESTTGSEESETTLAQTSGTGSELTSTEASSGSASTAGDDGLDPSSSSTFDASSESEPPPPECEKDHECPDPALPLCLDDRCQACTVLGDSADAACNWIDNDKPVCTPEGCVRCTATNDAECSGETPICDLERHDCVGCSAHEECGAAGCNLETGRCLDTTIVHVDADHAEGCSNAAEGTESAPLCSLQAGISRILAGRRGTVVLHAFDDGENYASATIDENKEIALLGRGPDLPLIQSVDTVPALRVLGANTLLYVEGIRISNSGGAALDVSAGRLYLDRSEVSRNQGDAAVIRDGGSVVLRNDFIVVNGTPITDTTGVRVVGEGSHATILYTTLGGNQAHMTGGADSLRCEEGGSATVRNSLVLGARPESIDCTNLDATFNAADQDLAGIGNVNVGPLQTWWFRRIELADFHIIPDDPFADIARWRPGDPPIDFDGDPRPFGENAPDYPGADHP